VILVEPFGFFLASEYAGSEKLCDSPQGLKDNEDVGYEAED
jgi:hypothetical protein